MLFLLPQDVQGVIRSFVNPIFLSIDQRMALGLSPQKISSTILEEDNRFLDALHYQDCFRLSLSSNGKEEYYSVVLYLRHPETRYRIGTWLFHFRKGNGEYIGEQKLSYYINSFTLLQMERLPSGLVNIDHFPIRRRH